jgi:CspA family cold shock protein
MVSYIIEVSMQGTIKRIVRDRGFGFIRSTDGQEVFFHRNGLQQMDFDSLQEGASVEFEAEQSEKGPRATNVRQSAG